MHAIAKYLPWNWRSTKTRFCSIVNGWP